MTGLLISFNSKVEMPLNNIISSDNSDSMNDDEILSKINEIQEFNIGHFIIGESIFFGLAKIIKNFKKIIKH